jgi:hypothetical protein
VVLHFLPKVYLIEGEVMKARNTITRVITITMAVAALAAAGLLYGAGWLQPVEAQSGDGSARFVSYASVGIVPGEKVRLTVGNNAETPGSTVTWTYKVTNTGGDPLYESEGIQVSPGWFRYSEVSRGVLNTEGEPGTGRAEVMVTVAIEAPAGSNPEDLAVSTEVIKEETGATSGGILQHEVGHWMGLHHTYTPEAAIIGFIPGESLSLSVFNPPEEGGTPVRAQAYIYDGIGRLTARSAQVDLRPGQSYTFAFNHDDLPMAGEEGTGRKQVRALIQVFTDGSVRPFKIPVWVKIVNNRTGSTKGGPYFTGSVTVSGDGFGER